MGISFGSIGTGVPKDIVQQIMAAERVSLNKLEIRKDKIDAKNALVDELGKLVEVTGDSKMVTVHDTVESLSGGDDATTAACTAQRH